MSAIDKVEAALRLADENIARDDHRLVARCNIDEALSALAEVRKELEAGRPHEIAVVLSRREDGGLRIYSEQAPGLILSGKDPEKVIAGIWPATEAIRALPAPPPKARR